MVSKTQTLKTTQTTKPWTKEDLEDPYTPERWEQEEREGTTNPIYLAHLWWAQRKATRRFRAAPEKFGPKKKFHPRKMAKRFTRRGPSKGNGKGGSQTGWLFIGESFAPPEHVPETEVRAFFNGKP